MSGGGLCDECVIQLCCVANVQCNVLIMDDPAEPQTISVHVNYKIVWLRLGNYNTSYILGKIIYNT